MYSTGLCLSVVPSGSSARSTTNNGKHRSFLVLFSRFSSTRCSSIIRPLNPRKGVSLTMIYCDKISPEMESAIERVFCSFHDDPMIYSFYMEPFLKRIIVAIKTTKQNSGILKYAIKKFMEEKISNHEIAPRYNLRCLTCHHKIYKAVESLDNLPEIIECGNCHAKLNTQTDYLYYDLRYVFCDKPEPEHIAKIGM